MNEIALAVLLASLLISTAFSSYFIFKRKKAGVLTTATIQLVLAIVAFLAGMKVI